MDARLTNSGLFLFLAAATATAALASTAPGCAEGSLQALGGGGTSNSTASGTGGVDFTIDGGTDDDAGSCAAEVNLAVPVTLDLYIMLDQSGSMDSPLPGQGNPTRWQVVKTSLASFLQQPSAAGIGVGLQYFGLWKGPGGLCPGNCYQDSDCGAAGPCNGGRCLNFACAADTDCGAQGPCDLTTGLCDGCAANSCDAVDYEAPDVEIDEIPGVAPAILASLDYHAPVGETPTAPALKGAIDHALAWAAAHPSHTVAVVLATDGDPSNCDTNPNHLHAIAASGVNATPQVLTYVIGVGPSLLALDGIAQAGGTKTAFHLDTSKSNVGQQFLDAMNTVRAGTLACQFDIPKPSNGVPDFDKVNVRYTPGDGGAPITFPRVDDEAHCPADGDAWYYDAPQAPTKIIVCGATCATLTNDPSGHVDVLTGCKTIIN
jgi:hypothetical protein